MGVVESLYHPDTVLTASELESLALGLLDKLPIPGVEGCYFDSGIIRQTLLQASVDQKSIKAVTEMEVTYIATAVPRHSDLD